MSPQLVTIGSLKQCRNGRNIAANQNALRRWHEPDRTMSKISIVVAMSVSNLLFVYKQAHAIGKGDRSLCKTQRPSCANIVLRSEIQIITADILIKFCIRGSASNYQHIELLGLVLI